ncbi:hypothetical protein NDU88_001383 [Pleurodeles waltl]|uniref:Uncharacterized protein n=1 Tax=Pleurodeles waltl TaxID=8319 RepID=A0AAV7TIL6_PLEWA|nr:hypothetical protein NDU88_001383 [Pleurodeles waltl]
MNHHAATESGAAAFQRRVMGGIANKETKHSFAFLGVIQDVFNNPKAQASQSRRVYTERSNYVPEANKIGWAGPYNLLVAVLKGIWCDEHTAYFLFQNLS